MLLRDLHPVERPRERLARLGPEALGDAELLALVLRTGYKGRSALEVAAAVLAALPEGVHKAPFAQLERVKGVGASRAAALTAAFELARRGAAAADGRAVLDSPGRVLEHVPAEVRAGRKEHFLAFYLNARSQLLCRETVSIGTLSASLVHPREVFAPAISHSAAAVIVAHNHPSGDCTPSAEDKDATRRLSRAGELLGIPLLDHLIVSTGRFFSFKDHGLM
jgi:DNA repair protein RadC